MQEAHYDRHLHIPVYQGIAFTVNCIAFILRSC